MVTAKDTAARDRSVTNFHGYEKLILNRHAVFLSGESYRGAMQPRVDSTCRREYSSYHVQWLTQLALEHFKLVHAVRVEFFNAYCQEG